MRGMLLPSGHPQTKRLGVAPEVATLLRNFELTTLAADRNRRAQDRLQLVADGHELRAMIVVQRELLDDQQ